MCQAWGESAAHSHTHSPPRRLGSRSDPRRGSGRRLLRGCSRCSLAFLFERERARVGRSGQQERARPGRPGAGALGPGFRIWGPGSGSRSRETAALGACASAARPPAARAPASPAAALQPRSSRPPSPLPPRPNRARPFLPRRRAPRPRTRPAESLPAPRSPTQRRQRERPQPSARPCRARGVGSARGSARARGRPPSPPRSSLSGAPGRPVKDAIVAAERIGPRGGFFFPQCPGWTAPLPFVSGAWCLALSDVHLRPGRSGFAASAHPSAFKAPSHHPLPLLASPPHPRLPLWVQTFHLFLKSSHSSSSPPLPPDKGHGTCSRLEVSLGGGDRGGGAGVGEGCERCR